MKPPFLFHAEVFLPRPREEIFPFFAAARNLETLTPAWLKFEVLTPDPIEMRAGALIEYCIRVHGVPFRWRTEISEWSPPHRFVDVQLSGPYTLWHHTHTFEPRPGGTFCLDDVRYRPKGGSLINWLFVQKDVTRIFQFRQRKLLEIFGGPVPGRQSQGATGAK